MRSYKVLGPILAGPADIDADVMSRLFRQAIVSCATRRYTLVQWYDRSHGRPDSSDERGSNGLANDRGFAAHRRRLWFGVPRHSWRPPPTISRCRLRRDAGCVGAPVGRIEPASGAADCAVGPSRRTTLATTAELLISILRVRCELLDDDLSRRLRCLSEIRNALADLRGLSPREMIYAAPVVLSREFGFARTMISTVRGSVWRPQHLYIEDERADPYVATVPRVRRGRPHPTGGRSAGDRTHPQAVRSLRAVAEG